MLFLIHHVDAEHTDSKAHRNWVSHGMGHVAISKAAIREIVFPLDIILGSPIRDGKPRWTGCPLPISNEMGSITGRVKPKPRKKGGCGYLVKGLPLLG